MPKTNELSGKSYDQQLDLIGEDVVKADIAPNRRVPGETVFEPMGNGVRVTARDESHRNLWGFVASKAMLEQAHCLVGVYDPLSRLIKEELQRHHLSAPADADPIATARRNIDQLEQALRWLRGSLDVKEQKAATVARARSVAMITGEALRQINLDSEGLKGMKSKSTSDAPTDV